MDTKLTRRKFLGGMAAGGAAMALAAATGCAPGAEPTQQADATGSEEWDEEVDLLICGCGGSGMSCAIEAHDNGVANILIIEKLGSVGGTTSTSQGMIAGYDTSLQKAQSVTLTYDEMYANLMNNASYRLDPALTKITVERCGETIDWLIDRVGVVFMEKVVAGYGPLEMMHIVEEGGGGLANAFADQLDEAGIEIRKDCGLIDIVVDAEGVTQGAVIQKGSSPTRIKAKAVMIATGGYSCNPELSALLDPEKAGTFGIGFPGCEGDGIIAASNRGAALSHINDMMCVLKDHTIMSEHNGTSASANVNGFTNLANMILVGAEGTRFCNEGNKGFMTQNLNEFVFNQMHKDDQAYVWMISDQATVDATEGKTFRGENLAYLTGTDAASFAQELGVDAATLTATIDAYNAAVDAGVDTEFGRFPTVKLQPPFVALPVVPCQIITYGGIARNENSEVLRADGSVIPGLYVGGEASCNSAYMGFTLSNCFTWGRISGKNAAAYMAG